jgi:hypothetical protein
VPERRARPERSEGKIATTTPLAGPARRPRSPPPLAAALALVPLALAIAILSVERSMWADGLDCVDVAQRDREALGAGEDDLLRRGTERRGGGSAEAGGGPVSLLHRPGEPERRNDNKGLMA